MAKSKSTKSKAWKAKTACRRAEMLTKQEVLIASLWDYACRILHTVHEIKGRPGLTPENLDGGARRAAREGKRCKLTRARGWRCWPRSPSGATIGTAQVCGSHSAPPSTGGAFLGRRQ
jgi:hypothetical protein